MSDPILRPGTGQTFLGPSERARAWERLGSEQFDVVVIGGGVVGAGCALDAATRGLKVALVEARDFASGTSSRSSKMFHGGLRYLEQLEFGLVREALHERELSLTTLAPHLVKPLPFLFPLTKRVWERPYIAAGIFLYDQLGGAKSVPPQKHLTKAGALRLAPGLKRSSLVGGIRYYDTVVDDARHTMTVARTAAHYGAVVRTSTQVVKLLREGDRVIGVTIRDSEDGSVEDVRGHVVINATGVWTDEIQALSKERGRFRVRASKGVHIVVPRDRIVSEVAIILRTEKSVLFVIPWGTHWIIGTTDTDWNLDLAHPAATKADIDYILGHVNTVLATSLTHDDIDGVYAGLRPLLAGESEETSKLSREHAVAVPSPGLVAIAGGKYTTYRVMADDAVDAAAEYIPARVAPSITEKVPLMGADGYFALINQTQSVGARYGLHPYRVRHLLDRYGSLIGEVLELAADKPELLEPITDAPVYLKVEAAYAAAAEGALHLEDILARRMRISIEYQHRGVDCAAEVADIVAPILGWSEADCAREVATYIARVEAEVLSQRQPDDESADALRAAAPEARAEILEPVPLT
ncbi:glycerol-3-phosphate dehydrogenase [Mycolicibacterium sp. BK556]|uniref:glycerol-3-phosphate dehydrogenase n=1 Tax=Mycobacteriaceae TaxID=1762 RepID=UPI00105C4EF7|nr:MULTISPECIES: glycerol-3-phosphate dehydrogenase [Mycobacteriaceae]MBB3602429.1 glycerol-3-phosphate dehydrogenase [Mycolicibacterium sp. BK556]MBB3632181.1 glycerol-3-phosphate dehydrogenase [Mycolicibacterium sp. BK607]MBB3750202.1 glycerol-3-phosphate dehydrogenase [Mycolicibacterium sp. BK634]TDO18529.1 glycerol-3-phosphate dehydrogenase [Mycobacterium sp. BK086]